MKGSRGYACIGLDEPKFDGNVGGVIRAAGAYGAAMVAISGSRFRHEATNTPKAHRHIPLLRVADLFDALPLGCVPIAVDLISNATPLPAFQHPASAFYIFGSEDRTLGPEIVSRCQSAIYIPTNYCMNLAATVNVVLYDRMAKLGQIGRWSNE